MCAPDRVCVRGKSGWTVLWTRIFEEPLAERRWVGVAAMLKMSVGWAWSRVCRVRYCFDYEIC